jgi:hypothetical protein
VGTLVGLVTLDDLLSLLAEPLREMRLAIEAEQRRELKAWPCGVTELKSCGRGPPSMAGWLHANSPRTT